MLGLEFRNIGTSSTYQQAVALL